MTLIMYIAVSVFKAPLMGEAIMISHKPKYFLYYNYSIVNSQQLVGWCYCLK